MALTQNTKELVNIYDLNTREWGLLEDVVMMVLGDDVFCIGFEGAVHKLIVIWVCSNRTKMVVNLNHLGVGQVEQGLMTLEAISGPTF